MFGLLDYLKLGAGAALGAFLASLVVWPLAYGKGHVAGRQAMAAAVERQNSVAAEAAGRARSQINDCFASGGEWEQETGSCVR